MKKFILLPILLFLGIQLWAQERNQIVKVDTIVKDPHYNLSIDGGLNIPTAQYDKYLGFSTEGWQGSIALDRYWREDGLGVGVDATYHTNDVEDRLFEFNPLASPTGSYTTNYGDDKHQVINLSIGPTYKKQFGKVGVQAYAKGGATWADVADYSLDYSNLFLPPTTFYTAGIGSRWAPSAKGGARVGYQITDNIMVYAAGDYKRSFFDDFEQTSATRADVPTFSNGYVDEVQLQPWAFLSNMGSNPRTVTEASHIQSFGLTAGVQLRMPRRKKVVIKETINVPVVEKETVVIEKAPQVIIKKKVVVFVKDQYTGIPLKRVKVKMVNKSSGEMVELLTKDNGTIEFDQMEAGVYEVSGVKNGVETNRINIAESDFENDDALVNVELEHNDPRFTLEGTTIDKFSRSLIGGVNTILTDKGSNTENNSVSNASGTFSYQLGQGADYRIMGERDGYFSNVENISTKGLDRSQTLYVNLKLGVEKVELGTTLTLDKVYYDLDACSFQLGSEIELDRVLRFLQSTPSAKIEIGAHTDSRGSAAYNNQLSQCRAESVLSYLTQRGIAPNRIIAVGYGESKPVNRCVDGVSCSDAEYQQNRRTEFKIIQ